MKKGFTLTEILLALTIIGVVSMLVVPALISNFNKKTFATHIKNMAATIEQVAQDELARHRARDLSNTDFADPDALLSDNHFHITKKCSSEESNAECWKTGSTGSDKVTYKLINGTATSGANNYATIVLKNGAIISYKLESNSGKTTGYFVIDVNGNDKPNIIGRDKFAFWISPKGTVISASDVYGSSYDYKGLCKGANSNAFYCYAALVNDGWKMDY